MPLIASEGHSLDYAMADVRLRIVGECIIEVGARLLSPDAPHLFALMLFLCCEKGRVVPKSELTDLLFPEEKDSGTTSHNLRQLLYRLRQLRAPLIRHEQGVLLDVSAVTSTLDDITQTTFAERSAHSDRRWTILPHYEPPQSTRMAEWVDALRDRTHHEIRRRLSDDLQIARQRADWPRLERIARRTLELDPLNETATLSLAEAIARTGSKQLAVSLLEKFERELGGNGSPLVLPAQLLRKRITNNSTTLGRSNSSQLPLIGRGAEMEELLATWSRVRSGHFRTVYVTGETSIGKTRLVEELAAIVEMENSGRVLVVRPTPADVERPLSLFADLVKQLIALPGAAGVDPASLPFLRRLAGAVASENATDIDHSESQYLDAAVRRAVGDLLDSVSAERPLLCIVDRADNLDQASGALLVTAQKVLSASPILFVLCESDDGRFLERVRTGTGEIRLSPLGPSAAQDFLVALSTRDEISITPQASDWCLAIAAGNPGHLELLVGHAARAGDAEVVPLDLLALADERIAELSADAQYALQAISIAGNSTSPSWVGSLTGLSDYHLLTALHELDKAALIIHTNDGLRCRSALIGERSTRSASPVVAALMHARAARLLEEHHAETPLSQAVAWRIASHWRHAGEGTRARGFLRACWRQAITIGQPMVACTGIREAIRVSGSPEERAELLDELITALQSAGEMGALVSAVDERASLSLRVGDSRVRDAELSFDGIEARVLNLDHSNKYIASLLDHARSSVLDLRRRVRAVRILMITADGDLDERLAGETYELSERIVAKDPTTRLLQRQVALIYHSVFGNRDEALQIADELDTTASAVDRSWHRLQTQLNTVLARYLVDSRPWDYAALEAGYRECLNASMNRMALRFASRIASCLIDDGELEEARRWLDTADSLAGENNQDRAPVDYYSSVVDLSLMQGNVDRAQEFIERMRRGTPVYESQRLRHDLLVYGMRVEQLCTGTPSSVDDIDVLLAWHERSKSFGRHDDHVQVLWTALHSVGRNAEASSLLAQYLTGHRRERRSYSYLLRSLTASDPVWSTNILVCPSDGRHGHVIDHD
jgi:DNA-binding SARP family transcriptional activator/Cdc6-like AAA superfamily ATPase